MASRTTASGSWCWGRRSNRRARLRRGRGQNSPITELAEPAHGTGATNAVADFRRAGSHDVLAPGTHKCGQTARGINRFSHDWEIGQHGSWDVQTISGSVGAGSELNKVYKTRAIPNRVWDRGGKRDLLLKFFGWVNDILRRASADPSRRSESQHRVAQDDMEKRARTSVGMRVGFPVAVLTGTQRVRAWARSA